ncbi:hypothetical protein BCV69DRAFT_266230 [Microstroma glucosiphilum]|uniref:Deoxycytidylate deaminase n=1 Tax=Pseudomicrostroma glucosiphilum TaxID=1684307 RepID=A0A316UCA6_9BASI|nr:hypothetical protein BCV69DRAFT_266230 [Pseudomicrostroma glucosiphilum]PWN22809.1 hypothetical protein BCV69DRAFT_266230 [Pseudomicrostroma glucosiphilum]
MLISLVGPPRSGKHTIASYLCIHHGFRLVHIDSEAPALLPRTSAAASNGDANHVAGEDEEEEAPPTAFRSPGDLLEYSTANWFRQLVTVDLTSLEDISIGFDKRPWFLMVSVEAPLSVRWRRARRGPSSQLTDTSAPGPSLEDFVAADDRILYGYAASEGSSVNASPIASSSSSSMASLNGTTMMKRSVSTTPGVTTLHLGIGDLALHQVPIKSAPLNSSGLYSVLLQAQLRILNPYETTSELYRYLSTLALPSLHRLRPSWETYFLSLCTLASLRSNCMKRRVGAVLVRNNRVLSTGYNGTPRGLVNCNEGGCPRCNASATLGTKLDECLCLHAEENALLECGRERGGAEGTVLYCNTCPCLRCAVKIVQTGVKEVVYQLDYSVDHRSSDIFKAAGVVFRKYHP